MHTYTLYLKRVSQEWRSWASKNALPDIMEY